MDNLTAPIPSTPTQPAFSSSVGSPNRHWLLWLSCGLAVLALGIAVGILSARFLNQSRGQLQQNQPTSVPVPLLSETPSQENDPTADWKTYSNTKHSYSVKLPQDWQPDRGYPGGQYSNEQLQTLDSISWFKRDSTFSIQALFDCSSTVDICFKKHQSDADKTGGPYTTKNTTTEMNSYLGQSALVARSSYKTNFTVKGIFVVQKGKLWMFETQSIDAAVEKETDQILSTFKFLETTSILPILTSPTANSKVSSPLTIKGVVPASWMFEGVFPIKLVDANKNLIVQGQGREAIPGSWSSGKTVEFIATLTFTTASKSGFVVLEKDNPSGLLENNMFFEIPVDF